MAQDFQKITGEIGQGTEKVLVKLDSLKNHPRCPEGVYLTVNYCVKEFTCNFIPTLDFHQFVGYFSGVPVLAQRQSQQSISKLSFQFSTVKGGRRKEQ